LPTPTAASVKIASTVKVGFRFEKRKRLSPPIFRSQLSDVSPRAVDKKSADRPPTLFRSRVLPVQRSFLLAFYRF